MPADARPTSIRTSHPQDDGADPRGGDRKFHMYLIAMLALGDTVAAVFVLKAVYLLL